VYRKTGLFLIVVFLSNSVWAGDMKITNEQAIEIANRKAISLGYNAKFMNMQITLHNVPWNKCLPKEESTSEYVRERQNKLNGKEYWAIYYYPRPQVEEGIVKGGDVCIFVDSQNGEVLTNYRGK